MRFAINFVTANGTTIDGTLYPANGTYTIQSSVSGNMVVNYDANKVGGYWAQAECFENTTGGFYPNAGTVIVETGGDGKPYITFNSTSTILAPTSNKTTNTYKFHIGTPPSSSHDVTITNGNSTYGTLTGTTLMTVDDGSSISITNSGKTLTIDGQSVTATPNDSDYVLQSLTVNGIAFTSGETYIVTGATNISATFRRVRYYELTLLDNESADYYNTFASRYNGVTVDEVTYERTFVVGRWSTVCLPFTVAVEEIVPAWEQVYEFVRATGDANATGDGMMLYFRKATTLLAGKCYLVYNTGVSDISSTTFTDVTIITQGYITRQ